MHTYDLIVLALLIFAAIWGARRGFTKQLASVLSIVLGYVVAVNFRQQVAPLIGAPPPWNNFAAMLALFMVTSLMVWIAFRFVNGSIEKAGLTAFDTQIGGLVGLAKGFLVAVALTMVSVVMLGDTQRQAVLGSFSGNKICQLVDVSQRFIPTEWRDTLRPYLETVEAHTAEAERGLSTPEQEILDDPFATASPSDQPAFSDALLLGPSFDEFQEQLKAAAPPANPSYPQATLQTPVFER